MTTALTFLILIAPFAVAAALSWAAHRSDSLRLRFDQFRWPLPWRAGSSRTTATPSASPMTSTPSARASSSSRPGRAQARWASVARNASTASRIDLRRIVVDQVTGAGHVQIRCPVAGFRHCAHLPRRCDRVARLDQQRGRPAPLTTVPSSRGCPTRRRSRSTSSDGRAAASRSRFGRTPRGSTARRRGRTRRKPFAAVSNSTGKRVQPRLPRAGGAAAEVRRHVLDDERTDQVGPRSPPDTRSAARPSSARS